MGFDGFAGVWAAPAQISARCGAVLESTVTFVSGCKCAQCS